MQLKRGVPVGREFINSRVQTGPRSMMLRFVHGWCRKLGLATLLLALFFTANWVRSLRRITILTLTSEGGTRQMLSASPKGIAWIKRIGNGQYVPGFEWRSTSIDQDDWDPSDPGDECYPAWRWKCCGSLFGKFDVGPPELALLSLVTGTIMIWRVPHWFIVLPLILLSTWLLLSRLELSKPSRVNPQLMEENESTNDFSVE